VGTKPTLSFGERHEKPALDLRRQNLWDGVDTERALRVRGILKRWVVLVAVADEIEHHLKLLSGFLHNISI
jgi:hypothetical protein